MDEKGLPISWLLGGISAIIGTLAVAINMLWTKSEAKNEKAIAILEAAVNRCEQDRLDLRIEIHDLKQRIEELEDRERNAH